MSCRISVLLAPLVFAGTSFSASGATIYSEESSFMAAVQAPSTIDFEGLVGTPEYPSNHPFVSGGHMSTSSSGITVDGVQFVGRVSFGTGFETYIFTSNPGSFRPTAVLWGGRGLLDITFPSGSDAIGFDFGSADDLTVTITVTESDGTTVATSRRVTGLGSQFFGYVGNDIHSVKIDSGQTVGFTPYVMADNVTIAAPIPEPREALLMLVGLGVLAMGVRGRCRADQQGFLSVSDARA